MKNLNCSIAASFERYKQVTNAAKKYPGVKIRGYLSNPVVLIVARYVSCVMGCPYEGDVPIPQVVEVSQRLFEMGCYELSLGDTIGVGTAGKSKLNYFQWIICGRQNTGVIRCFEQTNSSETPCWSFPRHLWTSTSQYSSSITGSV